MDLRAELAGALGAQVTSFEPVGGGDINDAHRITLADGRVLFVKSHRRPPAGMFEAEARGLSWLSVEHGLRVPRVPAVGAQWLALEWIERGTPGRDHDERLGRGLAALHRTAPDGFGLDHDNFIGTLPQDNAPATTWHDFYRARRLEPQLRRAVDAGRATGAMRHGFDRLFARLPSLVGPPEPPARLHGDLWGGNAICDADGAPVLIDPATHGGHREMDLAMMRLFGGFSERVFDAYAEAHPLTVGHGDRIPLCQLYPLMVHVNLFGGSYAASVERALAALV